MNILSHNIETVEVDVSTAFNSAERGRIFTEAIGDVLHKTKSLIAQPHMQFTLLTSELLYKHHLHHWLCAHFSSSYAVGQIESLQSSLVKTIRWCDSEVNIESKHIEHRIFLFPKWNDNNVRITLNPHFIIELKIKL